MRRYQWWPGALRPPLFQTSTKNTGVTGGNLEEDNFFLGRRLNLMGWVVAKKSTTLFWTPAIHWGKGLLNMSVDVSKVGRLWPPLNCWRWCNGSWATEWFFIVKHSCFCGTFLNSQLQFHWYHYCIILSYSINLHIIRVYICKYIYIYSIHICVCNYHVFEG